MTNGDDFFHKQFSADEFCKYMLNLDNSRTNQFLAVKQITIHDNTIMVVNEQSYDDMHFQIISVNNIEVEFLLDNIQYLILVIMVF